MPTSITEMGVNGPCYKYEAVYLQCVQNILFSHYLTPSPISSSLRIVLLIALCNWLYVYILFQYVLDHISPCNMYVKRPTYASGSDVCAHGQSLFLLCKYVNWVYMLVGFILCPLGIPISHLKIRMS